jgi:hypothetical protein
MKSFFWSITLLAVVSVIWTGAVNAADEGAAQDELVTLCDSNAAKLQNILTLRKAGYSLAEAQESVKADIDRRVESFMRVSIGLAYQSPDDVAHALETRTWQKTCVDKARKH